jgi:hypothetical protein
VLLAGALWWLAGTRIGAQGVADPAALVIALLAVSGGGVLIAALLALWLDHHVVGHLRGIAEALRTGRIESLRDLPSSEGWGELSSLTRIAHARLAREQSLLQAADELERTRQQLAMLRGSLERWLATERWEPARILTGPLAEVADTLDRGFARDREVREQNQEASRLMRAELEGARDDARESVEQAERGFVEATALLTSVRELQRLGAELGTVLATPESEAPSSGAPAPGYREVAARAIEELVAASVESVDRLASGLRNVQGVGEQVRLIANRSTLIALNAALGGSAPPAGEDLAGELKALARDVRAATERSDQLARDLETEVAAASARMRDVRGRVSAILSEAPAEPAVAATGSRVPEDADRLMDRVREMIQDATSKGERLSAAGERSSRAAQRLVRRLEEHGREFDGLIVRLAASSALPEEPRADEPDERGAPETPLRLLERDVTAAGDDAGGEAESRP